MNLYYLHVASWIENDQLMTSPILQRLIYTLISGAGARSYPNFEGAGASGNSTPFYS